MKSLNTVSNQRDLTHINCSEINFKNIQNLQFILYFWLIARFSHYSLETVQLLIQDVHP